MELEPFKRAGAVADLVFGFLTQLRQRNRIARRNEQGIVTKAAIATRGQLDVSLASAFEKLGLKFKLIRVTDR